MNDNTYKQRDELIIGGRKVYAAGSPDSRDIFIQPVDDHDLEALDGETACLGELCGYEGWCVCALPVGSWSRDLSPWEAPPVFGREGFGNGAAGTLSYITEELVPYFETNHPAEKRRFFICGYSLAGFFALWSAYQTDIFAGAAAVSPSVWYPGWIEYAEGHSPRVSRIYLSLGDKEEKTRNRVMASVGDAIRRQYALLSAQTECTLEWNQGNHFVDSGIRTAKGMAWLIKA